MVWIPLSLVLVFFCLSAMSQDFGGGDGIMCSFTLKVKNLDLPDLGTSTISLTQGQLNGTLPSKLSMSIVPGLLDIEASFTPCNVPSTPLVARREYRYESFGGAQQVTLVCLPENIVDAPIYYLKDYYPIINFVEIPEYVRYGVYPKFINAESTDFGVNAGIQSWTVKFSSHLYPPLNVESNISAGLNPVDLLNYNQNITADMFEHFNDSFPVPMQIQVFATDVSRRSTRVTTTNIMIDPTVELSVKGILAASPEVIAMVAWGEIVPKTRAKYYVSTTVADADLMSPTAIYNDSIRLGDVTVDQENVECFGSSTLPCQHINCTTQITWRVTNQTTSEGLTNFVIEHTIDKDFNRTTNFNMGNWGISMCKFTSSFVDSTSALQYLVPTILSDQRTPNVTWVVPVSMPPPRKPRPLPIIRHKAALNSRWYIGEMNLHKRPVFQLVVDVPKDGSPMEVYVGNGDNCPFPEGLAPSPTELNLCWTRFSTTTAQNQSTHNISSSFSFHMNENLWNVPGTVSIDIVTIVHDAEIGHVIMWQKSGLSILVEQRRSARQRPVRQLQPADNIPNEPFQMSIGNGELKVKVGRAYHSDVIPTTDEKTSQQPLLSTTWAPTPPTIMSDAENKIDRLTVAIAVSGSILVLGVVTMLLIYRKGSRQKSMKVVPFMAESKQLYSHRWQKSVQVVAHLHPPSPNN